MSITASDIYERVARIMGARTGTIGASPQETYCSLNGLVGTTGDDTYYAGYRLIFIDAVADADKERLVTAWRDQTGTAVFNTLSVAPTEGDRYILVPREDYTLNEYRLAFDKALNQTPRTYRQVVPLFPLLRNYQLSMCDWLNGSGDIDAVYMSQSPLMLHNEDFSLWENGTAAAPDGYTLTGTGATIARTANGLRSAWNATITAGGAAVAELTQPIPQPLNQWITRRTFPVFYPVRCAAWVSTTTASSVRVFLRYTDAGVTTTLYSDYITGNGVPQFPELSLTPTVTMDDFEWGIQVAATRSAVLGWAGMMQNTISFSQSFQIKDSGSQAMGYKEYVPPFPVAIRNMGGVPEVELATYPATWGQLVVYVRRPFPAYASDADTFDDQYARVLTAGLCNFLLEASKPQQDRARLDRIRMEQMRIWTRLAVNITDLPVPAPPSQVTIVGM